MRPAPGAPARPAPAPPAPVRPVARLTPREREVLGLMADGCSNAGIAEELVLSPSAVAKHINAVFTKLGVAPDPLCNRRVQAVRIFLCAAAAGATPRR
ncbi:response regulator transcription factor [Nocardiopsis coralliicola]